MDENKRKNLIFVLFGGVVIAGIALILLLIGQGGLSLTPSPKISKSGNTITVDASTGSFSFSIQGSTTITGRICSFLPFDVGTGYSNPGLLYMDDFQYQRLISYYKEHGQMPRRNSFSNRPRMASLLTDNPSQLEVLKKLSKNPGALFSISGQLLNPKSISAHGMNFSLPQMPMGGDSPIADAGAKIIWIEKLSVSKPPPELIWKDDYPPLTFFHEKIPGMPKLF